MRDIAVRIVSMLGMDAQFERLVDGVLGKLRAMLLVPEGADFRDPNVDREFATARQRLLQFRSQYTDVQVRNLVQNLGEDHLSDALAVLTDPRTVRLLQALGAGAAEKARQEQALARRMNDAVLLGESAA